MARKLVTKLEGEIEIDESYVSAGQKGTKCEHRAPRKRGLKLRGGNLREGQAAHSGTRRAWGGVVLSVAEDLNREHILGLLKEHVSGDCSLYTDDFPLYASLPGYEHRKLNRYSSKEYVRGDTHINTAEGVFSLLSWLRMLRGMRKDKLSS